MKKILFIITHSEYGGAQRFLFSLISKLDKSDFDMSVAFGTDGKEINSNTFLQKELGEINVLTYHLTNLFRKPSLFSDVKTVFEIRRLIKKEKPDTLFLASSKAGFLGSLAMRFSGPRSKTNVIYRIGGWTFNDPWPAWKRRIWIILERLSARWKDYIVVNSQKDLETAKHLKITPRKNTVLIHNGIDPYADIFLDRDSARLKLMQKIDNPKTFLHSKIIVGTIANFYETKGIVYLIESANNIREKDISFVILGDGPLRHDLEVSIKEQKLDSNIFLLGQIPNASSYLKAFDIYVQPSIKEGFPWALLEAMTAKLPVIATNVGAVPEMIENGKSGFIVEPKKPGQIAQAVSKLIADDHLRQEFGIQANQTVHFKFGLDKMVSKIEKLLVF